MIILESARDNVVVTTSEGPPQTIEVGGAAVALILAVYR